MTRTVVPTSHPREQEHRRSIATLLNQVAQTVPEFGYSGTATLAAGTAAIDFSTEELEDMPDTTYLVFLAGDTAETFTWASKATTGFTINSSNASSTANVDWMALWIRS